MSEHNMALLKRGSEQSTESYIDALPKDWWQWTHLPTHCAGHFPNTPSLLNSNLSVISVVINTVGDPVQDVNHYTT